MEVPAQFLASPQPASAPVAGGHDERLQQMKRQFQILERAFHTLEGLCREEIQTIEVEQKRLDAQRSRSLARLQGTSHSGSSSPHPSGHHTLSQAAQQHHPSRPHDGNRLIKLNVGGSRMVVSQGTLLKYPGSIFELLLENLPDPNAMTEDDPQPSFHVTLDDEGHIFLDRDADLFRELLHFLRSGDSTTIRMLPPLVRRRVIEEARYFGFDQLLMELRSTRLEWACESVMPPPNGNVFGEVPAPRCFAAAQYVGNGTVYLFGGCTANDTFFDTLYVVRCCPTEFSSSDALIGFDDANAVVDLRSLDNTSPTQYVASYLGAGGGTTLHQQQQMLYQNAGQQQQQQRHVYGGGGGDGAVISHFYHNGYRGDSVSPQPSQTSTAMSAAAGGAAGGSTTTSGVDVGNGGGGVAFGGASSRPERYEFSLVRPRGDVVPPARSGHAMVYLQGHLVLLYGNDKGGHVQDVFAFNTFTQSWSVLTPRGDYIEPRSGHSVNVVHDKLLLIGGKQIFPTMKSFGDIFEGTVDFEHDCITWKIVQPIAVVPEGAVVEKRGYHSTALYGDNQIVIHGGIVKDVYCNDVCVYHVDTKTWQVINPGEVVVPLSHNHHGNVTTSAPPVGAVGYVPCQPRSGHIAVIHQDAMYVCGSYSEEHPQMILHSLCLRTFVWRRVHVSGKAPARRAAPSGVLLPQDPTFALMPRLLLFGGFDISSRKCFNDVYTVIL